MTKFDKDFTHKEVEGLCKEYNRNIKDFYKFMTGQTISVDLDGNTLYFGRDVRKFFKPSNVSLKDIYLHLAKEK